MPAASKTSRVPLSAYRLQFNKFFKFSDARAVLPYLSELGVTDIYASPYLKARPGSLHGYDIVRHDQLNPEVGTDEEYEDFTAELRRLGMGQILDIVPNHMCILGDNNLWQDVLENGRSSPFSLFFDIDWNVNKESLRGRALLPILARQYGEALEAGELKLSFKGGAFFVNYFDQSLPADPSSYELVLKQRLGVLESKLAGAEDFQELMSILTALGHLPSKDVTDPDKMRERQREKEVIKRRLLALYEKSHAVARFIDENIELMNGKPGEPRSFDLMDEFLSRQAYRPSLWRVATEEINYRRFFDINELAAIRVEQPEVFREAHKLILKLIKEGKATGLRVDHPDGLYNPAEYFRQLQEEAVLAVTETGQEVAVRQFVRGELAKNTPPAPFYIIGEKILLKGEKTPENWPVMGTTGYGFMNSLNGIFIPVESAKQMDETYTWFIRKRINFPLLLYDSKKLIMETSLSGEINVLGHRLSVIAEKSRRTRDYTQLSLTRAVTEVIACLPVYRTYISSTNIGERDRRYIELSVRKAMRMNLSMNALVFGFLKEVLLLEYEEGLPGEYRAQWLDFVMRFQQQTGPVMAKALEDTAFYIYNRLLSLNEVGGSPDRFGSTLETFHGQNIERGKQWPYGLIATSTHDSKRSGDVRARINVLTEIPREWREKVQRWKRLNKDLKPQMDGQPVPDENEEYHLYQTLVGAWPAAGDADFRDRLKQYMIKALREAKVNTSWMNPDTDYEGAFLGFVDAVLKPGGAFLKDFDPFRKKIAYYGLFNSLSQVLLKTASPGVPDFYQATEFWSLFLVDPDNRRPVDYGRAQKSLNTIKDLEASLGSAGICAKLLAGIEDGMIKQYLTWKALNFRKLFRDVFLEGDYIPLESEGEKKDHVCAFLRTNARATVLAAAPRFFTGLIGPGELPLGEPVWRDTKLLLPGAIGFEDVFTRSRRASSASSASSTGSHFIYLKDLFAKFPLALGAELKA